MSRSLEQQLRNDRALRNAAYALVKADIANLKDDWSRKGIGARSVDRLKDGASEVYDEAVHVASDNPGILAALLAAIGLWFARHPLLSALAGTDENSDAYDDEDEYDYDEDEYDRSDKYDSDEKHYA